MTTLTFQAGTWKSVGRNPRRLINQDCAGRYEPDLERMSEVADRGWLYVVADGMGGEQAGEIASRYMVDAVLYGYYKAPWIDPFVNLRQAIEQANEDIHLEGQINAARNGMGTTVVAAAVRFDGEVFIAHVGDSRAYLWRGGVLQRLTRDDSHVQDLLDAGVLQDELEALTHPERNVLTQTVGDGTPIEVHLRSLTLLPMDRLILCTDGVWTALTQDEVAEIVVRHPPQEAAERLVKLADERGGRDNSTAMVIMAQPGGDELDTVAGLTRPIPVEMVRSLPERGTQSEETGSTERGGMISELESMWADFRGLGVAGMAMIAATLLPFVTVAVLVLSGLLELPLPANSASQKAAASPEVQQLGLAPELRLTETLTATPKAASAPTFLLPKAEGMITSPYVVVPEGKCAGATSYEQAVEAHKLEIHPLNGMPVTILFDTDGCHITLSPDASWLAVSSPDGKIITANAIWLIGLRDIGELVQLTEPRNGEHDRYPAWSPDGKYVVFSRLEATADTRASLWYAVTKPQPTLQRGSKLLDLEALYSGEFKVLGLPAWGPRLRDNGDKDCWVLSFTANSGDSLFKEGGSQIISMPVCENAAGPGLEATPKPPPNWRYPDRLEGGGYWPAWSPEYTMLAFARMRTPSAPGSDIWLARQDSSWRPQKLVHCESTCFGPTWLSQDRLAFIEASAWDMNQSRPKVKVFDLVTERTEELQSGRVIAVRSELRR